MTFNPNHNIMSFFDNARQGFPEGSEYRTPAPETKTISTMTTEQQTAIDNAANEKFPFDEWSVPAKEMGYFICNNPSDFGLVSVKGMCAFIEWFTGEKSTYGVMYGDQDFRFADEETEYTPEQLFEIFKNKDK